MAAYFLYWGSQYTIMTLLRILTLCYARREIRKIEFYKPVPFPGAFLSTGNILQMRGAAKRKMTKILLYSSDAHHYAKMKFFSSKRLVTL